MSIPLEAERPRAARLLAVSPSTQAQTLGTNREGFVTYGKGYVAAPYVVGAAGRPSACHALGAARAAAIARASFAASAVADAPGPIAS